MPFIDTPIKGLKIFEPKVFNDSRGYFYESFNQQTYHDAGIMENFVQDNQSFSQKNSLRVLHYQLNPHAQSKLVRVVLGSVMDVVVDIRKGSETFGIYYSILLPTLIRIFVFPISSLFGFLFFLRIIFNDIRDYL